MEQSRYTSIHNRVSEIIYHSVLNLSRLNYKLNNSIRKFFKLKPIFFYLEVQLVDHCNLNCSGCSHYSPLAPEIFIDIEQYNQDLKQLSQFLANIREIHLLGGEPLLHPRIIMFFDSTRRWFPKAHIHLVTNGILLETMPEEFWEACRRNSILIQITLYPPLNDKESDFVQLAKREKTKQKISKSSVFRVTTNSKNQCRDLGEVFRRCRGRGCWPILKQGKIYPCAKPAYVQYFNEAFDTKIPDTGFVDLYNSEINGWTLLAQLEDAPEVCGFCTYGWKKPPVQKWAKSQCHREEWDVAISK